MDAGALGIVALLFGPFAVGVWLGRWWWIFTAPAIVLISGVLIAQTASPTYEARDAYFTDRGAVYLLTFLAVVTAFVSALVGTPIGYVRRRRSSVRLDTSGAHHGWEDGA
jgi:hypothetical protein